MKKYLFFFLFFSFLHLSAQDIFDEVGRIKGKLSFEKGVISSRLIYTYDESGRCTGLILDDSTSSDLTSMEGASVRIICDAEYGENYLVKVLISTFDFASQKPVLLKEIISQFSDDEKILERIIKDAQGEEIKTLYDSYEREEHVLETSLAGSKILSTICYDEEGKVATCTIQEQKSDIPEWKIVVAESREYYRNLSSKIYSMIYSKTNFQGYDLSIFDKFDNNFEELASFILGKTMFRAIGYYTYPVRTGVYGKGEADDKVRVTFINGIMNYPDDHIENLDFLSRTHGNVNIHYVFRSFEGWSRDMFRCILYKFGYVSTQAVYLAQTWKELIAEMGGTEGGGLIIHIAHSVGATETDNAKSLMTADELKMIRIYTFGAPTIIHHTGLEGAINFVSMRDYVCYLDPLDFFMPSTTTSNIVYLDEFFGKGSFVVHLLSQEPYLSALRQIGKEFIDTYPKKDDR
jgi:hypothetical protein